MSTGVSGVGASRLLLVGALTVFPVTGPGAASVVTLASYASYADGGLSLTGLRTAGGRSSPVKNTSLQCDLNVVRCVGLHDFGEGAEDFCGHAGCGVDQARQEVPEPCEQQAAVVADGAEDGVDGVAVMAVEVVSFERTIGFHVAEHGLDAVCLTSAPMGHLS